MKSFFFLKFQNNVLLVLILCSLSPGGRDTRHDRQDPGKRGVRQGEAQLDSVCAAERRK